MMQSPPYQVLIADDDRDTADTMGDLLALEGYRVRVVYGGLQAVEAARALQPQLVVLDIDMPVLDGHAAAAAIRRDSTGGVVLIAHTAAVLPSSGAGSAALTGFDHCLFKPADSGRLCALVASSLAAADGQRRP